MTPIEFGKEFDKYWLPLKKLMETSNGAIQIIYNQLDNSYISCIDVDKLPESHDLRIKQFTDTTKKK